MDNQTRLPYSDLDRRDLTTLLLLRLVELSPAHMQNLILGFTRLCDIEAEHAKNMVAFGAQSHTSTLKSILPLTRDCEPPPCKRSCISMAPPPPNPSPASNSRLNVLERLSNATYHGMENLTCRIFHNITVTKGVHMDCGDVAQGVLDWIHRSGVSTKKKQFTVRPCNRRTGDIQMVYTNIRSNDSINETIALWIMSKHDVAFSTTKQLEGDDTAPSSHKPLPQDEPTKKDRM
jgi:hypothetical protein